jgi:hypothetical protein
MANEFTIQRTAHAAFALANVAATVTSGVLIPAGALITGIRIGNDAAITKTNASGTVVPKIGTVAIAATVNMSDLPELNLVIGTSATSTASGTVDYYVDYLYVQ